MTFAEFMALSEADKKAMIDKHFDTSGVMWILVLDPDEKAPRDSSHGA